MIDGLPSALIALVIAGLVYWVVAREALVAAWRVRREHPAPLMLMLGALGCAAIGLTYALPVISP
jgi:predicted lysophospholipase L1 biosynthesis ABC-type transport system permease subunit